MPDYQLPQELVEQLREARSQHKRIVLATGVFDLFHQEHKNFLQKAKEVGDVLVVGVEPDTRVKKLKGEGRPIQNQAQRMRQVQDFVSTDYAVVLPENFDQLEIREAFLRQVHPNTLAVSSHSPYLEKKQEMMKNIGGEVKIVHQQNPEISTTKLLQKGGK